MDIREMNVVSGNFTAEEQPEHTINFELKRVGIRKI